MLSLRAINNNNNTRIATMTTISPTNNNTTTTISKPSFLSKEALYPSSTNDTTFNRWLVVPPAIATHLSIGSLYAWSLLNEPLTKTLGVVSVAAQDWNLSQVVPVFSTAVGFAGLTAAISGRWAERVGPRAVVLAAGGLWGGGLIIGSIGASMHSLPLLYLGVGVLGGTGIGLSYGPPVANLLHWFPDRRGLASGMAIMGFGSGALVAAPIIRYVAEKNFTMPTYLGTEHTVATIFENGQRIAVDSGLPVVIATLKDIKSMGFSSHVTTQLQEGVYVVGTGSNGVSETLFTLGLIYTSVMVIAAMGYRIPRPNWVPKGYQPISTSPTTTTTTTTNSSSLILPPGMYVDLQSASTSPQFARIWLSLFLNATAGISLLGVAKTMMSDVFGTSYPTLVDAAFCASYVAALSAFNGLGRLGWAAASDKLGRKNTFTTYFALGIPLYLSVPYAAHLIATTTTTASTGSGVVESLSVIPLMGFTASTLIVISMYGGGFAISPAYLADVFGSKDVGSIYGRLLTAWSAAGLVGPTLLATLRRNSEVEAIRNLALKVDPQSFQTKFGTSIDNLQTLIDANGINIAKLMTISPPGTIDPTPFLYDSTMVCMSGLLAIGLLNNLMMKPVSNHIVKKLGHGENSGGDGLH
jgi:MFS family permease